MAYIIKVTFPNGKTSCYRSPLYTVIDVLRWIGSEHFHEIDFMTGQQKIVTQTVLEPFKKYSKEIEPGWFYIHRSDTREKTNMLINLNTQFNLNLKIEEGDFKYDRNPVVSGSTRSKYKISVTMPDNSIVDYDSFKEVFIECIYQFGPRRLAKAANLQINKNIDLFSPTDLNGDRLKVDDNLYVFLPRTAKEAYTYLNLISKRLRINLQVQYLPMAKTKDTNNKDLDI